jgi:extracellular elastinolytic metalloproteinase
MRFIPQIGLTLLLATRVFGHPKSTSTSRNSVQRRVIDLGAFRLKTIPSYSNATVTSETEVVNLVKREDYIDTATELANSIVPGAQFRLADDHYVGVNGIAHVNFKQTAHGLDIDNADFNVNVSQLIHYKC